MPLKPEDQQPIVDAHNAYRSDPTVQAQNVVWDATLATGAQTWADNLATTVHQLQHSAASARPGLGENIAQSSTGSNTAAQMVDLWGKTVVPAPPATGGRSEQAQFKPGIFPNVSKDGGPVGHYTQMIWGATTKVGCGMATDSTTGNDYLVCRYSPQGNMSGMGVPATQPVPAVFVCCGQPGFAWGVDTANTVYQYFISGGAGMWIPVLDDQKKPVQMKQVGTAYDTGTLWGLDPNGGVYQQTASNSWTAAPGGAQAPGGVSFQQLSVASSTSIWATGLDGNFWQNNGTSWTKVASPDTGVQCVSVAFDGTVWGIGASTGGGGWSGKCYQFVNNAWTWMQPSGGIQVSCGSATNVWHVNALNDVWQYTAAGFKQVYPGTKLKQISAGYNADKDGNPTMGMVWGIGMDSTIWQFVNSSWAQLRV